MPGIYYAWAENILEKSPHKFDDPASGKLDVYQDMVLNVNLGLSSYGYFNIMNKMGDILIKKKQKKAQFRVEKKLEKKEKLRKEILLLNQKAV